MTYEMTLAYQADPNEMIDNDKIIKSIVSYSIYTIFIKMDKNVWFSYYKL